MNKVHDYFVSREGRPKRKWLKRINRLLGRNLYFDFWLLRHGKHLVSPAAMTRMPDDARFNLAILCIIKDEDEYLDEWLNFHSLVGVEHFFVYDNGCSEATRGILRPYIESGWVSYLAFPHVPHSRKSNAQGYYVPCDQKLAYGDCISRFGDRTKWLLPLDLDEFLYPTAESGFDTLAEALQAVEREGCQAVEVSMHDYGSNWHKTKPAGLVIESYTKCAEQPRRTVKTIVQTRCLKKLRYAGVHKPICRGRVAGLEGKPKVMGPDGAQRWFRLNHYVTKSFEEFRRKKDSAWMSGKYSDDKFFATEELLNRIDSPGDIIRYLPRLEAMLAERPR